MRTPPHLSQRGHRDYHYKNGCKSSPSRMPQKGPKTPKREKQRSIPKKKPTTGGASLSGDPRKDANFEPARMFPTIVTQDRNVGRVADREKTGVMKRGAM